MDIITSNDGLYYIGKNCVQRKIKCYNESDHDVYHIELTPKVKNITVYLSDVELNITCYKHSIYLSKFVVCCDKVKINVVGGFLYAEDLCIYCRETIINNTCINKLSLLKCNNKQQATISKCFIRELRLADGIKTLLKELEDFSKCSLFVGYGRRFIEFDKCWQGFIDKDINRIDELTSDYQDIHCDVCGKLIKDVRSKIMSSNKDIFNICNNLECDLFIIKI